jgi:hypothetical protein
VQLFPQLPFDGPTAASGRGTSPDELEEEEDEDDELAAPEVDDDDALATPPSLCEPTFQS